MATYHEIIKQVEHLTTIEQLRLLEEIVGLVRHKTLEKPKRNIFELEGLGKEIWQGIEAQDYVNQQRDSWDG